VCVWTCQTGLLTRSSPTELPLCILLSNVSSSVNLAESVCVRHSPQEALHSLCCSFHSFCGKCKIRRMRKASVVYALVTFVSVVLEILINSTSLTEYTFRVFSSSANCVLSIVFRLFYHSLSLLWWSLNIYLRVEWELCCASWCFLIVATAGWYQHRFNHRLVHTEL